MTLHSLQGPQVQSGWHVLVCVPVPQQARSSGDTDGSHAPVTLQGLQGPQEQSGWQLLVREPVSQQGSSCASPGSQVPVAVQGPQEHEASHTLDPQCSQAPPCPWAQSKPSTTVP